MSNSKETFKMALLKGYILNQFADIMMERDETMPRTIPCAVCGIEVTQEEISNYAIYGGLPSPCCKVCFEVNDYSIECLQELKIKSLSKRILNGETI